MALALLAVVLAYLLGAIPGGLLLGPLGGVDLRRVGSGNAGATNALRARGPLFGIAVFVFDAGKGAVAAALLPRIAPAAPAWLPAACAGAAIIGHVFPIWFRLRGGKGFATALGVIGVLSPPALGVVVAVWALVLILSGYVSLATLAGGFAYAAVVAAWPALRTPPLLGLALFLALFLIFTHRANVQRLASGRESRFERARLFRRRAPR